MKKNEVVEKILTDVEKGNVSEHAPHIVRAAKKLLDLKEAIAETKSTLSHVENQYEVFKTQLSTRQGQASALADVIFEEFQEAQTMASLAPEKSPEIHAAFVDTETRKALVVLAD